MPRGAAPAQPPATGTAHAPRPGQRETDVPNRHARKARPRGHLATGRHASQMKHATSRELYSYWDRLRGTESAPLRSAIEPSDIRRILADTFIAEAIDPTRYNIRLAGTRVCALYGTELKGSNLLDRWSDDDRSALATLAAAGGEVLVVAGYIDQGGKGIIQASLDTGAFDTFYLPDGMVGDALPAAIGSDLNGSYGANPGTNSPGAATYADMAKAGGFKAGPFSAESYDAAALILLAMQAAGSPDSAALKDKILDVANAPGEKIFPGELAKALDILKNGGDIDYVGASAVELVGAGESAGNYRQIEIANGGVKVVGYR